MESHLAMGKADDLSYPNSKEQNMNTDGSLPTEPIAPKGAVQCCSNELCTGFNFYTSHKLQLFWIVCFSSL